MSDWSRERPAARGPRLTLIVPVLAVLLALLLARSIATYYLEYEWWREMGQVETWTSMIFYSFAPAGIAALLLFIVLWVAHARGMKAGGTGLREHPLYARVTTLALLIISYALASIALEPWTVIRYVGALRAPQAASWRDPVFGHALRFYIFDLPFLRELVHFLVLASIAALLLNWITSRAWMIRGMMPQRREDYVEINLVSDLFGTPFARIAAAVFLLAVAASLYLGRYSMLFNQHSFLVGLDYTDENFRLPLQWLAIGGCVAGAAFVMIGRWRWLILVAALFVIRAIVPAVVGAAYVRPNELSLEKPYIERHIAATRSAFGLDQRLKEIQYPARIDAPVIPSQNQALFENVRLWDWRAFHDTVTQIQALRQYFVFPDTDVDRYTIDGQLRQVMVAPRELDVRQLGGNRSSWINQHFIYTHGYGLVMASASRITPEGQPVLFIQDAPPKINTPGITLNRPELYFGETLHEPVFVRTQQAEFNYPAGSENVHTKYAGRGGIPATALTRLAAAISYGDWNIMLTGYLSSDSRMLIRRKIGERVNALANFLEWDPDPYLVVTADGRLVWMLDAYTTSDSHPYSRQVNIQGMQNPNYLRNSVKATVDAYDGTVTLYVFDDTDPIIQAWRAIFPRLFKNASEMPADLRAHVRYPELMFRAQAEIYRTFHMRDAEAFYNKEDLWDLAKENYGQAGQAEAVQPTFVIATLPGETQPEFLLITSFTPRGKDNMIGLMAARSDREHLGEIVVLQLSKQALIYGPLQVEARIDSDQNISKDLTLWNQQGSQVLRGQLLVLPVEDTFLYLEPIYIQSSQARMPQLKKVALAVGNRIIYRDTYEQAVAELAGSQPPPQQTAQAGAQQPVSAPAPAGSPAPQAGSEPRLESVRQHLRRYRELMSQGRFAEAGRELEAVEQAVK